MSVNPYMYLEYVNKQYSRFEKIRIYSNLNDPGFESKKLLRIEHFGTPTPEFMTGWLEESMDSTSNEGNLVYMESNRCKKGVKYDTQTHFYP